MNISISENCKKKLKEYMILFLVSLIASTIGGSVGIGGGIIIKPVLDILRLDNIEVIRFLSGCTVFAMSSYSVLRIAVSGKNHINFKEITPLALGAVLGGVSGNGLFSIVKDIFGDPNRIGVIQSLCLAALTFFTLLYTINKEKIKTCNVKNLFATFGIGIVLGAISSFLGIGGGPVNLIVLYYFFSMKTKVATQNSLYIIFFGQLATLIGTALSRNIPASSLNNIILMVMGGVLGGLIAQKIHRRISERMERLLLMTMMVTIIGICIFNVYRLSNEYLSVVL